MLLTLGTQLLGGTWQSWYVLGTAALFIVVVQVAPGGLAGLLRRLLGRGRDVPALPSRIRALPRDGRAGRDDDAPLLEVRDVVVSFGGTPVLQGASLVVRRGECVCLIGPNGAGKSTLLGAIAGSVEVASGAVLLGGEDVTDQPTHRRARRGLARMFQVPRVFDDLTVADNRRAAAVMAGPAPAGRPTRRRTGCSPASCRWPPAATWSWTWCSPASPSCCCSTSRRRGCRTTRPGSSPRASGRRRPEGSAGSSWWSTTWSWSGSWPTGWSSSQPGP
ncbi:hypothetical protein A7K94_0213645 [Modestobacter sp. VKM Ac-2676]|nr:hypothetical protein A7K94_0213645 [Modestobacter sp. VKM Ac-2676]